MPDLENNTDPNVLPEQIEPQLDQLKQENEILIVQLMEMKKILEAINK
jgi:hypothetical protein